MSGAQNAIVGDDSFGTNIPETQVPDNDLTELQNAAKFSQSKEFKRLKALIETKIEFYKKYLPGGEGGIEIAQLNNDERGWRYLAHNLVIDELTQIIQAYENANEIVKDAATRR